VALHEAKLLRGVICTTTDGLVRAAGIEDVAEIHGAIDKIRCLHCREHHPAPQEYGNRPPPCPACGGATRPDMVLFGEQLPRQPRARAASWVYGGGSLLVLGADLTRPPIHRIPEEMMKEGGRTIGVGSVERGAITRVRGLWLGGDVETLLPALVDEVVVDRG
jgi:NAD-dependent deacetylase